MKQFYHVSIALIELLGGILFGTLAVAAFLCSAYVEDAYAIEILVTLDHPLWNLLFLVVFLGLSCLLSKAFAGSDKSLTALLVLTCLWMGLGAMAFSVFAKVGPASDCGSVYVAAKQFASGDYSALSYTDSYFSCYPFQLGLTFFYELIFRITGITNYRILQAVNALCLVICVLAQFDLLRAMIRERVSKERGRRILATELLLTIATLPYMMYGSFIYGEIPSFAFLLLAMALLVRLFRSFDTEGGYVRKVLYALFATLSLMLAMMVRYNTSIFLIALAIIGILTWMHRVLMKEKVRPVLIGYLILTLLLSILVLPAVKQLYAQRSGTQINPGIPAQLYLAMGSMEGSAGPGGYSGYNIETFTAAGYDAEAAAQIGTADLQEQLRYWSAHPGEALCFYATKFVDQWLNTGWSIFDSTYVSFGERLPIIESMYSGALYPVMKAYMTNEQMILYLGAAIGVILLHRRKEKHPWELVFLLTAIGGALFYTVWEASGRYILPYAILMLPNAAAGIEALTYGMDQQAEKFIHRRA